MIRMNSFKVASSNCSSGWHHERHVSPPFCPWKYFRKIIVCPCLLGTSCSVKVSSSTEPDVFASLVLHDTRSSRPKKRVYSLPLASSDAFNPIHRTNATRYHRQQNGDHQHHHNNHHHHHHHHHHQLRHHHQYAPSEMRRANPSW